MIKCQVLDLMLTYFAYFHRFCRFREGICISKHDLVKLVVSFQLLVNYGLFIVDRILLQRERERQREREGGEMKDVNLIVFILTYSDNIQISISNIMVSYLVFFYYLLQE